MTSYSPILNNLDADDLAVRLFAILRLQELTNNQQIPEKLRQAAERESDPALKLYLNWLAYPENSEKDTDPTTLAELLKSSPPPWQKILRLLLQTNRQAAPPLLELLRNTSLSSLPQSLLPVLVGFFSRFGDERDLKLLESWCSHDNPAVTILAIEGLSRIKPDRLHNFLYPLLTSESAGIRSRAIRLLHRWHPEEALRQLVTMLESDIIDERRAALAHAFFLPFSRIKQDLIRFLIRENEPSLLVQAGQILIINPDIDVAKSVANLAVEASAEKMPVLNNILLQQCVFLARLQLINEDPQSFSQHLLTEAKARSDTRRLATLTNCNLKLSTQTTDLTNITEQLKSMFSLDLPTETLLPVVEHLAELEPVFLTPYLPALLQFSNLDVQIASLSALARSEPAKAEKLLEQYLCSANPTRRGSGIKVLSRLDRNFAQPLLLKTLASESESELLSLLETLLSMPLPDDSLMRLIHSSNQAEPSEAREKLIDRLCQANGFKAKTLTTSNTAITGLSQEEIMLGRAERQSISKPAAKSLTTAEEQLPLKNRHSLLLREYSGSRPYTKIQLIIEAISQNRLDDEELNSLLQQETNEIQRSAIQSAIVAIDLQSKKAFSPVRTLKYNLARSVPVWLEVAASLVMMNKTTAILTAPLLQQMRWKNWPENILPFVLYFIAISGRPQFSSAVTGLLAYHRSEIRCAAIDCLRSINPGELSEYLLQLATDKDQEVAALARKVSKEIENLAGMSLGFSIFHRLQSIVNKFRDLSLTIQAALVIIGILLLSILLAISQPPQAKMTVNAKQPAFAQFAGTARLTEPAHRFEHWRQPAERGQIRVVFGHIEENLADGLIINSPALRSPIMIRHDLGLLPLKKNQHFNALVKIDSVDNGRIEATLMKSGDKTR